MSTINTNDDELLAIELAYGELTRKFAGEGVNLFACAAVMTKIAFMIYKTSLNTEDYNAMINEISDSRDKIKSFEEYEETPLIDEVASLHDMLTCDPNPDTTTPSPAVIEKP